MRTKVLAILIQTILLFASCDELRVYEKNVDIPGHTWKYDNFVKFEVDITDTGSHYSVYVNIRHAEAYPYSNLWIFVHTTMPNGEKQKKRVQLALADKGGRWFGEGMGDIWDYQVPIQKKAVFPAVGTYIFEFEQNMRLNPLPHIMAMGLRIEKAEKTEVNNST